MWMHVDACGYELIFNSQTLFAFSQSCHCQVAVVNNKSKISKEESDTWQEFVHTLLQLLPYIIAQSADVVIDAALDLVCAFGQYDS